MKIVKVILVNLAALSSLNAGDTLQSIFNVTWNEDFSKNVCRYTTPVTQESKNANILCNILVKFPGAEVDNEAFKLALRMVITGTKEVTSYATKKYWLNTTQLTKFYLILDEKLPKMYAKKYGKMKVFSKTAVFEFIYDATSSIFIDYVADTMSHEQLQRVRDIPGLHDSASDETIRQAVKFFLTILNNNIKLGVLYASGHKLDAAYSYIADTSILLVDITIKNISAREDMFRSLQAAEMSKKRLEIINLYIKYNRTYLPLREDDEDENALKKRQLAKFLTECKKIKTTFSGTHVIFRDSLNRELKIKCVDYWLDMQKSNDRKKHFNFAILTQYSKDRYEKLIEYYFHKDDWHFYKRLYTVNNFDNELKVSRDSQSRKYLRKLLAHSGEKDVRYDIKNALSETDFYLPERKMKKYMANNLLWNAYVSLHHNNTDIPPIHWMDKDDTNQALVTRGTFAQSLVSVFSLVDKLSRNELTQSALYAAHNSKWTKSARILQKLGIAKGYSDTNDFKSSQIITAHEALVMTVNTMDILKCGHTQCDLFDIIGENK